MEVLETIHCKSRYRSFFYQRNQLSLQSCPRDLIFFRDAFLASLHQLPVSLAELCASSVYFAMSAWSSLSATIKMLSCPTTRLSTADLRNMSTPSRTSSICFKDRLQPSPPRVAPSPVFGPTATNHSLHDGATCRSFAQRVTSASTNCYWFSASCMRGYAKFLLVYFFQNGLVNNAIFFVGPAPQPPIISRVRIRAEWTPTLLSDHARLHRSPVTARRMNFT